MGQSERGSAKNTDKPARPPLSNAGWMDVDRIPLLEAALLYFNLDAVKKKHAAQWEQPAAGVCHQTGAQGRMEHRRLQ